MEIFKHGNKYKPTRWRMTCPACNCDFGYDTNEVAVGFPASGDLEVDFYFYCPECQEHINPAYPKTTEDMAIEAGEAIRRILDKLDKQDKGCLQPDFF